MIKVAICDDQIESTQYAKLLLQQWDFGEELEIFTYINGKQLRMDSAKEKFDIIIMDIMLSKRWDTKELDENGMLLADHIKDMYPDTVIIFFSSEIGFERELIRHEPYGFVQKPIKEERLHEVVCGAIERVRHRGNIHMQYAIKVDGFYTYVNIKDIIYIESRRPKIIFHMENGGNICSRGRLDSLEKELREYTPDIIRVSKSFLVNKRHIIKFTSKKLLLNGGTEILVSRNYSKNFASEMEKFKKI